MNSEWEEKGVEVPLEDRLDLPRVTRISELNSGGTLDEDGYTASIRMGILKAKITDDWDFEALVFPLEDGYFLMLALLNLLRDEETRSGFSPDGPFPSQIIKAMKKAGL